MRNRMLAAVSVVLAACAGTEPQPTLSITPSGNQPSLQGAQTITASPAELANDVTWSLSGPGSLSGDKGLSVVYHPTVPPDPTPATVTASARGQSATVTFTAQVPAQPPRAIAGLSANVDVTYDAYDVPHIFCAALNDCLTVQGYIQAQDRLFQMDFFRRTARGRLAALAGPPVVEQDTQILTVFITRDLQRIEDVMFANLDPAAKVSLQAYAKGVNAYLAFLKANPALMPGEYAQLPGNPTPNDIPDWEVQDSLAIIRLQQFELSDLSGKEAGYGLFALTFGPAGAHRDDGRFAAYTSVQQPVRDYTLSDPDPALPSRASGSGGQGAGAAGVSMPSQGLAHVHALMNELHETFGALRTGAGSNNWAVDGAHSANGRAMVANDPHLALQYPPVWHLVAMTVGDGSVFNVAGVQFPGEPGITIGRGAHVAWGLTNVSYDVTDLYAENLTNCGNGPPLPPCTSVEFRDTTAAHNVIDVPISVKLYPIEVKGSTPVGTAVLVVPHHGPIVDYEPGPTSGSAISLRWTGQEGNTQDLNAFLGIASATAVGDASAAPGTAFAAIKNWAIAAQNFVVVDDQGNLGFDPHGLVPLRNWISATQAPWFPLPGNTGTAEWGRTGVGDTSCSTNPAPADCWVPDALLPKGVNPTKGYFATANGDPAGYTDDGNPVGNTLGGGLYPYLSYDWSDPTGIRPGRISEMLREKTTTGTQKVSLQDMEDIQRDHSVLLARLFEDRGFYPSATGAPAAYATGRTVLSTWASEGCDCPTGLTGIDPNSAPVTDTTVLSQSAGCLLFHTFLEKLLHQVFDDDAAVVSATTHSSFTADAGAEIRALFLMLAAPGTHAFCDDVSPAFAVTGSKTCEQQVVAALATAVGTLQAAYGADTKNWLWGRVHTLTTESALPMISGGFSAGPFARPGGVETVDVGDPDPSQASPLAFAYNHGSSIRFISVMDPSAASAQVKMQLPGAERDQPALFINSLTLMQMYVQNQYFDFLYGHQVDGKGVSTQRFTGP